jgi:hypothetical protein
MTTRRFRRLFAAATVMTTALGVALVARELPGKELCQRLTAEEVGAVLGSPRQANPEDEQCSYVRAGVPDLRLRQSPSETREEFLDLVKVLKGTAQPGPGGSVISSVAADQANGKISAAWFLLNKTPVELEFDRGVEIAQARALVEAALR